MPAKPPEIQKEKEEFIFREFGGVNQRSSRIAIPDKEFFWLENIIPIGDANLLSVNALSASLATVSSETVAPYYVKGVNLNGTAYILAIFPSGALYSINLTTFVVTTIAAAGTFSSSGASLDQWSNTNIVFVDPTNGYFVYDGTTLWQNGQAMSVSITDGGSAYTSATVTFYLWSGATASASLSGGAISGFAITNEGQGLTSAPTVIIVDPVGTGATATASVSGGGVYDMDVTAGGSGYVSPTVLLVGGGGLPGVVPTGTVQVANGLVTGITLSTPGSGMILPPIPVISSASGKGALATTNLVAGPAQGTGIAVYQGHVWTSYERSINVSAVGSFNDFSNSGTSFTIDDSTLANNITALYAANGYLYVLGGTSIDIIFNVQVTGNPATTTFNRTNVSSSVGSDLRQSIFSYYRNLVFANKSGFYDLSGSSPEKASLNLDNLIPYINFANPVTGGQVTVAGILCAAFSFTLNDTFTRIGGTRNILALWFDKKWWFASQGTGGTNIQLMSSIEQGSVSNLYGWIGNAMYQLFSNPKGTIPVYLQSKLYDGGSNVVDKHILKLGIVADWNNAVIQDMSITLDNETGKISSPFTDDNILIFVGSGPITFVGLQPITLVSEGYNFFKSDAPFGGKYFGITIQSSSAMVNILSMNVEWQRGATW